MTKLIIKLGDVQQLPGNIVLSIHNDKTEAQEIEPTNISLQGDEYIWTGPIPLGDFTASVTLPTVKTPLEAKFTNRRLLMQFLNNRAPFIQIRNGDKKPVDGSPKPLEAQQNISIGPLLPTTYKIYLLLIGLDNKLAAQYLGPPMLSWSPTVPDGKYKLIVIEYARSEPKCRVRSKES
jgi:hypothetical protein